MSNQLAIIEGHRRNQELAGLFAIGMTLRFFQRSRSKAGKDDCIERGPCSHLLHLDVGLSRCAADSNPL
jgi:hypothetical protein